MESATGKAWEHLVGCAWQWKNNLYQFNQLLTEQWVQTEVKLSGQKRFRQKKEYPNSWDKKNSMSSRKHHEKLEKFTQLLLHITVDFLLVHYPTIALPLNIFPCQLEARPLPFNICHKYSIFLAITYAIWNVLVEHLRDTESSFG